MEQQQHTIVDIEEREASPCIFRVHQGLRNANEKAYTPILVSIGPYHHGDDKLLPMEKYKKRYLELLLQRNKHQTIEDYLGFMTTLEGRARMHYADPVHLDSNKFVKMMLYDACFVLHFLRDVFESNRVKHQHQQGQQSQDVGHDYNPIVKTSWMRAQICRDLMLLENQLPFFVIFKFYDMSYGLTRTRNPNQNHRNPTPFIKLATYPIFRIIPRNSDISRIDFQNKTVSESKHFLDLVHNICRPSSREESNDCQNKNQTTSRKMPSVIELMDAGIKFEAVETNDEHKLNIFDIHFEHGRFKIPKFKVADPTETFFRNIIAYEQHSSDDEPKYFSDYTYLMDQLINSKEDVNQLGRCDVLDNCLGDDEQVALMFNKLGQGIIIMTDQFYYTETCRRVNNHCKRRWNRLIALLNRDYFKNIWVTVATIAAALLLLLTLTQTIIALIAIIISPPSRH
ncbi:UPF0481 protein [Camellia lanceoleosa]|uniref:UPF0481 protein n=1 Tax=Camellia lanceoleosa TaxID=1840588 RepID=A0ACC0G5K2_9ERIC|nr:UPF0481 protein [Camellia lanceoleosa]